MTYAEGQSLNIPRPQDLWRQTLLGHPKRIHPLPLKDRPEALLKPYLLDSKFKIKIHSVLPNDHTTTGLVCVVRGENEAATPYKSPQTPGQFIYSRQNLTSPCARCSEWRVAQLTSSGTQNLQLQCRLEVEIGKIETFAMIKLFLNKIKPFKNPLLSHVNNPFGFLLLSFSNCCRLKCTISNNLPDKICLPRWPGIALGWLSKLPEFPYRFFPKWAVPIII